MFNKCLFLSKTINYEINPLEFDISILQTAFNILISKWINVKRSLLEKLEC